LSFIGFPPGGWIFCKKTQYHEKAFEAPILKGYLDFYPYFCKRLIYLKALHSLGTFFKQDNCISRVEQFWVKFQNLENTDPKI